MKNKTKFIKKLNDIFKKSNGFSLVELIVVIAIIAVIAVVLVPSLMRNVEDSRKNKDIKTTDELVTAVDLALADESVYDEMLEHVVFDNVSCYIDQYSESNCENKIVVKESSTNRTEQYEFDDNERQNDEVLYYGAGNMMGVTITFSPIKNSNQSEYNLKDAIINKFVCRNTGYLYENEKLYNAIRSVVGDKIYNSSQTYRNSDFTIFIRMGTTGANDTSNQDAIKVYGQYNGTNLKYDNIQTCMIATNRSVGNGNNDEVINKAINTVSHDKLNFGENGSMGNNTAYLNSNGNANTIIKNTLKDNSGLYDANDKQLATWDELVEGYQLNVSSNYDSNKYITEKTMYNILNNNPEFSTACKVIIPDSVKSIGSYSFYNCKQLTELVISKSVKNIYACAFDGCENLTSVVMPDSVTSTGSCIFQNCTNLKNVTVSNSLSLLDNYFFSGCTNLKSVTMSNSITRIRVGVFASCKSLTDINFNGTQSEWNDIQKDGGWKSNCPQITVHCIDGDISI